jgi:hypothetical protein
VVFKAHKSARRNDKPRVIYPEPAMVYLTGKLVATHADKHPTDKAAAAGLSNLLPTRRAQENVGREAGTGPEATQSACV